MKLIGFSTGAIALSDFRRAIALLVQQEALAVEISSLRFHEWTPLHDALANLDLASFRYVSIHLPSRMTAPEEGVLVDSLGDINPRWPLILHPDAITDFHAWRALGARICIENMDSRKPIGRTDKELDLIYQKLPDARLCFDIGHAWQVDPTMNVAYEMLKRFRSKLVQLHVSEVNSCFKHEILSYSTIQSFRDVADMIPPGTPIILEPLLTQNDDEATREEMRREMNKATFALLPVAVVSKAS